MPNFPRRERIYSGNVRKRSKPHNSEFEMYFPNNSEVEVRSLSTRIVACKILQEEHIFASCFAQSEARNFFPLKRPISEFLSD